MNNQSDTSGDARQARANRRILLLIFGVGLVPVLLAAVMYYGGFFVPTNRTNNGTLILPPVALESWNLKTLINKTEEVSEKAMWRLLIIGEGACDKRCENALYSARQVNVALGREADRLIRYYLDTGSAIDDDLVKLIASQYPRLNIARTDRRKLLGSIHGLMDADTALSDYYIFVADPLGNIMMYYTPEQSGKDMLDDLKKLLKLSKIG